MSQAQVLPGNVPRAPRRLIEWTGERCLPWGDDLAMVYEHYHRYLFAAALAPGKRVLDLASGEGYGAALLATQADEVVAVDIDDASVEHARANYRLANLSFSQADMLELSDLADGTFDLVTCFEALEHVVDHDRLLAEILRLLSPDGILVLSTPDRVVYSLEQGRDNPFHTHEVTQDELVALLSQGFAHVRVWGQNVAVGSVITSVGAEHSAGEVLTLKREKDGWTPGVKLSSTYLLAVASRAPLPELPEHSTLVDIGLELVRSTQGELEQTRAEAAGLVELLGTSEAERDEARAEVTRLVELVSSGEAEREAARAEEARLLELLGSIQSERDAAQSEGARLLGLVTAAEAERDEAEAEGALVLEEQAELFRELSADHDEALRALQHLRRRAVHLERRQETLLESLRVARTNPQSAAMAELNEIKSSAIFPLLDQYRRSVERFAPVGSLRRANYQKVVSRAARLMSSRAAPAPESPGIPALPTVAEPEVSIIIPVYNNWELTVACLRSLAFDSSAVQYEVIAVDDASTDITHDFLPRVEGLNVVQMKQNSGFIGAVNAGLNVARGRFVLLLNNDTVVLPGWLDALMRTIEIEENVGVVGAKLVYPDGTLQEAGGIIWRDGSGLNYGRGGNAEDPSYNFVRDVDYCSGACLLVRKEIFDVLGGLDRRYSPAYYEDTDLAFAARKLGYRVVYQPEAKICHAEGSSNGTDEGSGVKRYQKVSREAFRLKWQTELLAQYESDPGLERVASRRTPAGHVLVVSDRVPLPNQDSGSKRMYELLLALRDLGLAVTFVPNDGQQQGAYSTALQRAGIEVLYGPLDERKLLRELAPALDVAILSRPEPTWRWQPLVRELCPETKIIYDTVDLHFLREARRAEIEADPLVARAAVRYHDMELSLARIADATLVVSAAERDVLFEEDPEIQVHVVPNIHGEEHTGRPFEERKGVLFVGSFPHHPNRDAAHWLVEEIMPLVRLEDPEIFTYIVGSSPTEDILALESENVRILGWVPDLTNLLEHARISAAPLRYGAGVKGKVGESMAHGLPVVTTRLGAEGMGLQHEHDVLVADGAQAFANEILRAYHDADLWTRLAVNGRRAIARDSSPYAIRASLAKILEEIGVKVKLPDASRSSVSSADSKESE
jgi:GT2 family glycosyltransferase/SAM-dependent methyltransferase/glycosyltransferase involved in cell wall biosynthesis